MDISCAWLTAVLATASAQAKPTQFPHGLEAVRITDGTARLVVGGATEPALTLLPAGVFFTETGFATLKSETERVQEALQAIREKVAACSTPQVIQPPPPVTITQSSGWSTGAVVAVSVASVLVGGFVGCRVAGGCQ